MPLPPSLAPRVVTSLLGSAQVSVALPCLASLLACAAEPTVLRLHDDGTLTDVDRDRLASSLTIERFVGRPEADERVAERLTRFPNAARFRARHVLGLKLFDIAFLSETETIRFCDSDILFRWRFSGLFELPAGASALFMSDAQNAYTVRSWHRLRHPRLRLPCRANTGIVVFDRRAFDLEFLEWFLARPELHQPPVWAEQTAWALLGQRSGACRLVDPSQLVIPREHGVLPTDAVAFHFVSPVRSRLAEALVMEPRGEDEEAVRVKTQPVRECGVAALLAGEIGRRYRATSRKTLPAASAASRPAPPTGSSR